MNPKSKAAMIALAAALLVAACGGGGTDSMLASAREYLAKNDTKAAIIQIKNALQKSPDSVEARLLLGSTLLETGDSASAEVELRKALDLKAPADQVVPKLAQSMLALRQYKKLTDEFGKMELSSGAAKADLQTTLATAYAALGNADRFQSALTAALAANPNHEPALVIQARQKVAAKDYDGALAAAEEIVQKVPKSSEAWRLKGDILNYAKQQPDQALAAYEKSVEIKPDFLPGHSAVLVLLLGKGDLDAAAKRLEVMKKVAPNHPQTKYLQAQLAYQKKDFKSARELSQQLLRIAPGYGKALQLAGAVEFQLNSMIQAEALLAKAVTASPELVLARRMLIMTYLRTGQAAKALTTLNQGIAKGIVDPEINTVAGEVYLQNGDPKKAEEYFAKAAKQSPTDARKQTSLALAHLAGGDADKAMGELQGIAAADSGVTADMALISAHLRRGDYDKALKAIDSLEKKQPDKPLAANLRGRTLLAKKDIAGARKSFERALAIDAGFFPAVASLAGLDMVDKKPEEAKKRFEALLAKDPKNGQALLALAELAARTGAPKADVAAALNRAAEANPTEPAPRLLLVEFYLNNKDIKTALSAAQNAVAAIPDNPEVLEALGRAQQVAGEFNQAITTFGKMAGLQPLSPRPLLRLADVHVANKNREGAVQALKKALDVKPDSLEAQRGLVMMDVEAKKFADAIAMARTVQKQRPKEAIGYVLEGDVNAAQKNWDGAVGAYRNGLKEAAVAELALKVHASLIAAGKSPDAEKFATAWVKDHPNDFGFLFYMGDYAITQKDFGAAEKAYLAVVRLQPGNAAAYNNLAWVTGRLNKPGAIEFAEKSLQLAPGQPAFMDTLAMLYSDKNDYTKALEWQNKALAAMPDNSLFKLNLAKIHIKGGKKDLARKELDDLAKLGDKFAGQAEVSSLLKAL